MKKYLEINKEDLYSIIADYSHCLKEDVSIKIENNNIIIIVEVERKI